MAKEYEVGYGRPPKHGQFKKGESGNPRGRPKGTKNLKTDLLEELGEAVVVKEGDRTIRTSKQRAMVKSLVARTLKGDTRAAAQLISLVFRYVDAEDDGVDGSRPLTADEHEVWAEVERHALRRLASNSDLEDGPAQENPES